MEEKLKELVKEKLFLIKEKNQFRKSLTKE